MLHGFFREAHKCTVHSLHVGYHVATYANKTAITETPSVAKGLVRVRAGREMENMPVLWRIGAGDS